jgi:hypothetical protein
VFLLTVVLVATNDSNKNEVKSIYGGGCGADVTTNEFGGQPVTTDTQTGHLLYTAYSGTCALLPYVITDVSTQSISTNRQQNCIAVILQLHLSIVTVHRQTKSSQNPKRLYSCCANLRSELLNSCVIFIHVFSVTQTKYEIDIVNVVDGGVAT